MDVDALCACKILQTLFRADNIQYTLLSVSGKLDLQNTFKKYSDQVFICIVVFPCIKLFNFPAQFHILSWLYIMISLCIYILLTLGAHAQRGLQYLVRVCVCLSVCLSVHATILLLLATQRPKKGTDGFCS